MRASEVESLLVSAGVKPTRQRVEIAAELRREANDVTAQELHSRLRKRGTRLGLATVYRTLGTLEDAGVIDAFAHEPGERCYRWCGGGHHHHLVCAECHRVVELEDCRIGPWLDELSAAHGFSVTGHEVEVTGVCADCR
jgi:Fur family transcriptional regulator, ferric uptake regulator